MRRMATIIKRVECDLPITDDEEKALRLWIKERKKSEQIGSWWMLVIFIASVIVFIAMCIRYL